jgi:hypothetical protein
MKLPLLTNVASLRQLFSYCLLLFAGTAWAQAPTWSLATTGSTQINDMSQARASAVDALGNVFVTGYFTGQVAFGNSVLTSAGNNDLFVAKYVPTTGTWAWAQRGGGTGSDSGYGIAVSGTNVYVTGGIVNNRANSATVLFSGTSTTPGTGVQYGATSTTSQDLVLAKYTDNGLSATLNWTQVGGGVNNDVGLGVAVSNTSVYVTGGLSNNTTNATGVLFGGSGTIAGTAPQYGAASTANVDLVVVKYTDNGPAATLNWIQVGGGASTDAGNSIAVQGASVYVTGYVTNDTANLGGVLFGGSGTTLGTVAQYGATSTLSSDVVLAKYTDNGPTATLAWTQVGGGSGGDVGYGVAVNGPSIYLTGCLYNTKTNASSVLFGGSGTTLGTLPQYGASATASFDVAVAKYTDNGPSATLNWTQIGGGTGFDIGQGIAVSGASVYVTGYSTNNTVNTNAVVFGGYGSTAGTESQSGASSTVSRDVVVAKYTDSGSNATLNWTQVGGGAGSDAGFGIAVSGQSIYVTGYADLPATFGSLPLSGPTGSVSNFLAGFGTPTIPLSTVAPARPGSSAGLCLYPNPVTSSTILTGTSPGAIVQVFNLLGCIVTTVTADTKGIVHFGLPVGLPAGVYMLQADGQAHRFIIE